MIISGLLSRKREEALEKARTFVHSLTGLGHDFECSFESSEDFGGRQASFVDVYPVDNSLAKDHKKFGGIFIRVWAFGEPLKITTGIFMGAERAEQSEPRRGVVVVRKRLGAALDAFEAAEDFTYHTWSTANFPWTTKSSRAVARQLEQFVSFREDLAIPAQFPLIEKKIESAIRFLDKYLNLLKPTTEFGREIINAYYSENLPDIEVSQIRQQSPPASSKDLEKLVESFHADITNCSLQFNPDLCLRVSASLLSKRFLIATGLAGSGKTKLAQAFARWITPQSVPADPFKPGKCYEVVPVGADWVGTENILGYPDGLQATHYVAKPALDLILHAVDHPTTPHFLILDEMNLSHVERYFADILSIIESDEGLELYAGDMEKPETWRQAAAANRVPPRLKQLPENLFIIGTVNVDETTYMFSPKVLDRANVIEFRMEVGELEGFLAKPSKPDLSKLDGKGVPFGKMFVDAANNSVVVHDDVKSAYDAEILLLFKALQGHGAEFGYRTAYETARFMHFYKLLGKYTDADNWFPGAFDCVVFQKLLPKLHGSRAKLGPVLKKLWFICVNEHKVDVKDKLQRDKLIEDVLEKAEEAARSTDKKTEPTSVIPSGAPYPLSAEKINRMWQLLMDNGFASFAEA